MSRTFSMNSGSGDTLKDSRRWGFRPKARQMAAYARPAHARRPPKS